MDSSVSPSNSSTNRVTNWSPNRHSNEELLRSNGFINLNQINSILRDPELPKSRLHIKNILKRYNEEKRRASTLSRIQSTINSIPSTAVCDNSSQQNRSNQIPSSSTSDLLEDNLDQLRNFHA